MKLDGVVTRLKNGWELGRNISFGNNRTWIQEGGIGRGGRSETVHGNILHSLIKQGIVRLKKKDFPTNIYELVLSSKSDASLSDAKQQKEKER